MNNKVNKNELEELKKILTKYSHAYTKEEKEYIRKNFNWIKYNHRYNYILREIYDELGMINEENNLYLGFTNLIDEIFGINRKIVEIGGGIIPSLSKHIALKQKHGKITVFDPRLAITETNISNLKLIREKFIKEKAPQNKELYIGLQPYGGTKAIIETACKTNTDFIIVLGELGIEKNSFIDYYEYDIEQQHLIYDAKNLVRDSKLGSLEITDLDRYGSSYPVIYNKRMK